MRRKRTGSRRRPCGSALLPRRPDGLLQVAGIERIECGVAHSPMDVLLRFDSPCVDDGRVSSLHGHRLITLERPMLRIPSLRVTAQLPDAEMSAEYCAQTGRLRILKGDALVREWFPPNSWMAIASVAGARNWGTR